MNEQVYKIARQADVLARERVPDLREIALYNRIRDEKFAESIVRECARVYWNIDDGEVHGEYVKALKKHFEIEK